MSVQQVIVPDIGDFKDVPIVEIHIKEGSPVNAEDPLITLESDKATMDVPAPRGGTVDKVLVKVGDRVSEGSPVLTLKSGDEGAMTQPPSLMSQQEPAQAPAPLTPPPAVPAAATPVAEMGGGGRRASCRRRLLGCACEPGGASYRARTERGPHQGEGHRREGAASPRKTC